MTYESNPFDWGFEESSSLKTLTQQLNPIYSEPMEVTEQKEDLYDFFWPRLRSFTKHCTRCWNNTVT